MRFKFFSFFAAIVPLLGMASDVEIKNISSSERTPHLREVSDFYNQYYRNAPYFYDASNDAWDRYINSFNDSPESILCLAVQDDKVIGAVIGVPLAKTTQKYKQAFMESPELHSLFFLGELSVQPEYKHLGVDKMLFAEFERQVREQPQFSAICVWQMESEKDKSSSLLWDDMGFVDSGVRFDELWKDTHGTEKVAHSMICWQKAISN